VFSPENASLSAGLAGKHKLGFPIVQDTGLAIARAFGLVFELPTDLIGAYASFGIDLPKNTGHAAWELPVPSRFVIDKAGIVRSVEADPDYTVRPEPDATLAIVRSIT